MPKLTPRKPILIAGIAALAFAVIPVPQAESTVDRIQANPQTLAPAATAPLCPVVRLRICRATRGRSAYVAQTPASWATARSGDLQFQAMSPGPAAD